MVDVAGPRSSDAASAAHPHRGSSLDLERISVLTEICGASGSPATIDVLVEAFLEDGRLRVAEMGKSLHRRDLRGLADLAHELQGSSGTIGAVALCGAAADMHRRAAAAAARPAVPLTDFEDLGRSLDVTAMEFQRAEIALRGAVAARPA